MTLWSGLGRVRVRVKVRVRVGGRGTVRWVSACQRRPSMRQPKWPARVRVGVEVAC